MDERKMLLFEKENELLIIAIMGSSKIVIIFLNIPVRFAPPVRSEGATQ